MDQGEVLVQINFLPIEKKKKTQMRWVHKSEKTKAIKKTREKEGGEKAKTLYEVIRTNTLIGIYDKEQLALRTFPQMTISRVFNNKQQKSDNVTEKKTYWIARYKWIRSCLLCYKRCKPKIKILVSEMILLLVSYYIFDIRKFLLVSFFLFLKGIFQCWETQMRFVLIKHVSLSLLLASEM